MRVLLSNFGKSIVHYWGGRYPELVGHLYSPGGQRGPFHWLPYALDNGAYGAFLSGSEFDKSGFRELMAWAKASGQLPMWVAVPDVVADPGATIMSWIHWAPEVRWALKRPLAFVVQDGMQPKDVPAKADLIFVGGSTDWKWDTVAMWCESFPRVHVGRVNSPRRLRLLHELGAESCDGTGWFRGNSRQEIGLARYLEAAHTGELHHAADLPFGG